MVRLSKKGIKFNKRIVIAASILFSIMMLIFMYSYIHGTTGGEEYEAQITFNFNHYPDESLYLDEIKADVEISYIYPSDKFGDIVEKSTANSYIQYGWYDDGSYITSSESVNFESGYILRCNIRSAAFKRDYEHLNSIDVYFDDYDVQYHFGEDSICNYGSGIYFEIKFDSKDLYRDINNSEIIIDIDELLKPEIDTTKLLKETDDSINICDNIDNSNIEVTKWVIDEDGYLIPENYNVGTPRHSGLYNISMEIQPDDGTGALRLPKTITVKEEKEGVIVNERVLTSDETDFYYQSEFNGFFVLNNGNIQLNYMYDSSDELCIPFIDYDTNEIISIENPVTKNDTVTLPDFPDDGICYEGYFLGSYKLYNKALKDDNFIAYYSMPVLRKAVSKLKIVKQPTKENGYTVKTNVLDKSPKKPTYTWQKAASDPQNMTYYDDINEYYLKAITNTLNCPAITLYPAIPLTIGYCKYNNNGELESYIDIYGENIIDMYIIADKDSSFIFNIESNNEYELDIDNIKNGIWFYDPYSYLLSYLDASTNFISIDKQQEYNTTIDLSKLTPITLYDNIAIYPLSIQTNQPIKVNFKTETKEYDYITFYRDYMKSDLDYPSIIPNIYMDFPNTFNNRLNSNNEYESYQDYENYYYIDFNLLLDSQDYIFDFDVLDSDGNKFEAQGDTMLHMQFNSFKTDYESHAWISDNDLEYSANDDPIVTLNNDESFNIKLDLSKIREDLGNYINEIKVLDIMVYSEEPIKIKLNNNIPTYDNYSLRDAYLNNNIVTPSLINNSEYPLFNFYPNNINDNGEIESVLDTFSNNNKISLYMAVNPYEPFSFTTYGIDDIENQYANLILLNDDYDIGFDSSKILSYENNTIKVDLSKDLESLYYYNQVNENYYVIPLNIEYEKPFRIKFNPVDHIEYYDIPGNNSNVLNVENLQTGTYRCKVEGTLLGFPTSRRETAYSNTVNYVKESTPSGGGSSHKKKSSDEKQKEEEKIEEQIEVKESKNVSYMTGYKDKTFKPNNNVTREEVAVILARISEIFNENSNYTSFINNYNDVNTSDWYSNYLGFISKENILKGYESENGYEFHPLANMTRAEFATAIVRMFNLTNDTSKSCNLLDITGKWYEKDVTTLFNQGYINGYEDNTFRGNQGITRAEVCKVLNAITKRFIKDKQSITKEEETELKNKFSDVKSSDWFYFDVLTATLDFNYIK